MDFRLSDPVTWDVAKSGPKPAHKVVVQTPTTACRVSFPRPGMYRLETRYMPDTCAVHRQFCEWVSGVDESALESEALAEWRRAKAWSPTMYGNAMRLTVFMDTPVYDASGKMSADLMDATSCACIIEPQGCWTAGDKWGLRWKVNQVKFGTEPVEFPPMRDDDDHHHNRDQNHTDHARKRPHVEFAFISDE